MALAEKPHEVRGLPGPGRRGTGTSTRRHGDRSPLLPRHSSGCSTRKMPCGGCGRPVWPSRVRRRKGVFAHFSPWKKVRGAGQVSARVHAHSSSSELSAHQMARPQLCLHIPARGSAPVAVAAGVAGRSGGWSLRSSHRTWFCSVFRSRSSSTPWGSVAASLSTGWRRQAGGRGQCTGTDQCKLVSVTVVAYVRVVDIHTLECTLRNNINNSP